ncbi:MAG TPA: hypothetical protein PLT30_15890, partial [Deltaproteobacteria bacterium]|nr:hypothetical protein [Deltaproteobacteria bacterium]
MDLLVNNLVLIIDKLNRGGAERQFVHLVRSLDRKLFAISVIILNPEGELLAYVKKLKEIQVIIIPRKGILNSPRFVLNMYSALKKI